MNAYSNSPSFDSNNVDAMTMDCMLNIEKHLSRLVNVERKTKYLNNLMVLQNMMEAQQMTQEVA